MKKLSVIIASLVLFAGMTFAQQSTIPTTKATPASSKGSSKGGAGATTSAPASSGTVKKVPATKTKPATPMAKPASTTK